MPVIRFGLLICCVLLWWPTVAAAQWREPGRTREAAAPMESARFGDPTAEVAELAAIPTALVAELVGEPTSFDAADVVLNLDERLEFAEPEPFEWELLPQGLVYRPYIGSRKAPRLAVFLNRAHNDSTLWEGVMGAQVGIVRFGTRDPYYPEGFQFDAESAADIRLDIPQDVDVRSTDYRVGFPLSYGVGRHRTRFGYYHISSHAGDEYLINNPQFDRVNFSRDVLILGHTYFVSHKTRVYGELGWAFHSEISEPWELQFGLDHAPYLPTGHHGELYFALHGHLREEVQFGGYVSAQLGWAWVGESGNRFRCGFYFFNGESSQYTFFDEHETVFGVGAWYDL